ncbi:MAG: glycoside hydrolase family 55 protein, partial [Phycisphaerales bacterium]|nr:glycoside hydrolase family 55 protein [Phycisphaerales bacterium]
DPDRHPNIPNVSHAGYGGGGVALPDGSGTLLLAVTSYGAVGDGVADDTAAVRAALADAATMNGQQPNGVTVLFPPGTYRLSGPLLIHGDKIQLRGLDRETTRLVFTGSLTDTYAVYPGGDPGDSNWSFNGGLVWFCHESRNPYYAGVPTITTTDNGFRFADSRDITQPASLGDRVVTVGDASQYSAGETIVIEINNAADLSTLRHLLGDGEWAQNYMFTAARDGNILPANRSSFRVYHTIESINGNDITLREPARFDLRPEWDPEIKTLERTRHDVGIAELTIELERDYEWTRADWHNQEPGFNGIAFTDTINGFVDGVTIIDPGGIAVFMNYCKNITVNDVLVDSSGPDRERHHHAFGFANTADSVY